MAAPGSRLLVLAPRRPGDGFAAAQVLSSLSLPAPVVALRTGHLTRRPNELVRVPRKQVVVVVTAALEVRCLDHNLKLLWVRSLADHFQAGGAVHEVAVMVTDHTVTKGDRGMVVVGASMPPQTLAVREEEGDVLQEELLLEKAIKARARGRAASGTLGEVGGTAAGGGSGRHFSYFALDGGTGEVRWKHEALDFHRNLTTLRESTVRTQHGLHDVAQMEEGIHYGEASCREYREAVLASLPHRCAAVCLLPSMLCLPWATPVSPVHTCAPPCPQLELPLGHLPSPGTLPQASGQPRGAEGAAVHAGSDRRAAPAGHAAQARRRHGAFIPRCPQPGGARAGLGEWVGPGQSMCCV